MTIDKRFIGLAVLAGLTASTAASAFVLLQPQRTWATAPDYIVDDKGLKGVTDGDKGLSRTIAAIESNQAWNGSGSGTVVTATAGAIKGSFGLGDGVPMLAFKDPLNACFGNCLAATFTGFFVGSTINRRRHRDEHEPSVGLRGGELQRRVLRRGRHGPRDRPRPGHRALCGGRRDHVRLGGGVRQRPPPPPPPTTTAALNTLYGGGGPNPDSCQDNNTCGAQAPGGCWCDPACVAYGDCCFDGPC